MSFVLVPTRFIGFLGESEGLPQMLAGVGDDAGYYAYICDDGSGAGVRYIMDQHVGYRLLVKSAPGVGDYYLDREPGSVFGRPCFGKGSKIYWTPRYGWILHLLSTPDKPLGHIPEEWQDAEGDWQGDEFYSLLSGSGPDGNYACRGTLLNGVPHSIEVGLVWPRWANNATPMTPLGVFEPVPGTGATGNRQVGLPKWTGSDGKDYWRSLDKVSGKYQYGGGSLRWDEDEEVWVIGVIGAAEGWWQGSGEPDAALPSVYAFTQNPGGEIEEDDITLTYAGLGWGVVPTGRWMAEVGICR